MTQTNATSISTTGFAVIEYLFGIRAPSRTEGKALEPDNINADAKNEQNKDFSIKTCTRCNLEDLSAGRSRNKSGFALSEKC
jgi:hypothetical protein